MGARAVIASGLMTGVVAGALAVAGAVYVNAPPPPPTPVAVVTPGPSSEPSATAPASSSPAATSSAAPSPAGGEAFGVGDKAPPLHVAQLGGGEIDLSALRGKPVWVNFMATWCEPCRDELPLMNGFAARYADAGLVVIAIDVREDEAAVDAFVKGLGVTFPVGLDTDGTAQSDWGAFALPVHFWVGTDGVVRDGALGGIGADVMAAGVQAILPGETVTP